MPGENLQTLVQVYISQLKAYDEYYKAIAVLHNMTNVFGPGTDEQFEAQVSKIRELRNAIIESEQNAPIVTLE